MRQPATRRGADGGPAARHAGRARGFTLIETTIALLVMMIALLGLSALFVYGINYNSGAQVRAVAMALAQQRMERLRESVFDEVVSSSEPNVTSAGYNFSVTITVATSGNLRTVTVTVTPKAGSEWAKTPVVLVTQRAGTGLGAYY